MQLVFPAISAKGKNIKTVTPSTRYDARVAIAKTVYGDVTKLTNNASRDIVSTILKLSQQKRR